MFEKYDFEYTSRQFYILGSEIYESRKIFCRCFSHRNDFGNAYKCSRRRDRLYPSARNQGSDKSP